MKLSQINPLFFEGLNSKTSIFKNTPLASFNLIFTFDTVQLIKIHLTQKEQTL